MISLVSCDNSKALYYTPHETVGDMVLSSWDKGDKDQKYKGDKI